MNLFRHTFFRRAISNKRAIIIHFVLLLIIISGLGFAQEETKEPAKEPAKEPFSYTIHNARDPFVSLVSPEGVIVNLEPQTEISDIHLEGIIFDPAGKSYAVINGNVFAENDFVGKFQLQGIKKDKIILQNGQNTHIIELIKEEEREQQK